MRVPISTFLDTLYNKINCDIPSRNTVELFNDNWKGRFILISNNNLVISACYHQTKKPTASCQGGFLEDGTIPTEAKKETWAVAIWKADLWGVKTYYNTLN